MKNRAISLLLIFFIGGASLANAQDWRALRTNGSYLYNTVYGVIMAYRVDTAWASGSDSVFRSFPVIQQLNSNCYSPSEGSWIGRLCVVKPNGDNVFTNYRYDSIVMKTHAGLGASWVMCDTGNVVATVVAVRDTNFCGLNDTVKIIALSSTISYINGTLCILSKHYGLISTPDLFHFPDDPMMSFYDHYSLVGMSNPPNGLQNLTREETFTYNVGDEFHWYNFFTNGGFINPYHEIESWAIYRVLEKVPTLTSDTLKYRFERCKKLREYYHNFSKDSTSEIFTNFHDTIVIIHLLNTSEVAGFDQLPGTEVYNTYGELFEHTMGLHMSGLRAKSFPAIYQFYSMMYPACWTRLSVDACGASTFYYDGIYGYEFECSYFTEQESDQLMYYKKGSIVWGTPYNCEELLSDEFNESISSKLLTIAPNPATDHVDITLKNAIAGLNFELFDLTGTIVKQALLKDPVTSIGCEDLHAGLYIYRITNAAGFNVSGKLAVQ